MASGIGSLNDGARFGVQIGVAAVFYFVDYLILALALTHSAASTYSPPADIWGCLVTILVGASLISGLMQTALFRRFPMGRGNFLEALPPALSAAGVLTVIYALAWFLSALLFGGTILPFPLIYFFILLPASVASSLAMRAISVR